MSARVPLLAVILLLASASPAQAGWRFEHAQEIAYAVWGKDLEAVCPTGLQTDYSTTAEEAGVDAAGKAWAQPGVCTIHFAPQQGILRAFEPYCSIFMHEAGHIAGYGHDHTGHGGIMDPNPTFARNSGRAVSTRRHGHASRRGRSIVQWDGTDPRCDRRPGSR